MCAGIYVDDTPTDIFVTVKHARNHQSDERPRAETVVDQGETGDVVMEDDEYDADLYGDAQDIVIENMDDGNVPEDAEASFESKPAVRTSAIQQFCFICNEQGTLMVLLCLIV